MSEIITSTADETHELGKRIAALSSPGIIIALTGSLGAGKTTLVKGVAEGLGIKQPVTSPSFTIIKEYHDGKLPLYHMDLYRIDNYEELYMIGFEELIYGRGLSIIEWSEKAEDLVPPDAFSILIEILPDGRRKFDINGLIL